MLDEEDVISWTASAAVASTVNKAFTLCHSKAVHQLPSRCLWACIDTQTDSVVRVGAGRRSGTCCELDGEAAASWAASAAAAGAVQDAPLASYLAFEDILPGQTDVPPHPC